MKLLNNIILWNDAPEPWQISFQDSATKSMEGIDRLNGFIYYYEIILLVLIGWLFISIFLKYTGELISYKYNNHGATLEIIWTCSPALILMSIAFPSFRLIYLTDEITESDVTIKVIGFLLGGLTLYILNKIKDTYYKNQVVLCLLSIGEKNNISNNNLIESFFTFFNIPNIRANKRIGPHNKQVISIIIGSLLGDAYANRKSKEGIRLIFKQSIVHKDYLFWLYEFFYKNGYCTNLLPRKYTRKLKKNNEIKEYFGYEFNTFSFRSLNWIHKMFYKNGKKRIKMDLLEKYLDPLILAIWIMDDGGFTKYGVRIATNCFTLEEVEFLRDLLKKKFNLNCTVQKIQIKDQWSLYIKAESMKNLRDLVLPYIHSSMLYKIGLKNKD